MSDAETWGRNTDSPVSMTVIFAPGAIAWNDLGVFHLLAVGPGDGAGIPGRPDQRQVDQRQVIALVERCLAGRMLNSTGVAASGSTTVSPRPSTPLLSSAETP